MKRLTQRDRVRNRLLSQGFITNVEAVDMKILRLSERIRELQLAGMEIEGEWLDKSRGIFIYRLKHRPVQTRKRVEIVVVDGRPVAREITEAV